jgi:hypothetical protein
MIGFPLALPMGWVTSPPYFTAATETITDMANAALANDTKFPPHRLDSISESDPDSVVDYHDPPPCPSNVKIPQPQLRARTYTQTGQSALRATQVRAALSHAYAVTYQNRITDKS